MRFARWRCWLAAFCSLVSEGILGIWEGVLVVLFVWMDEVIEVVERGGLEG